MQQDNFTPEQSLKLIQSMITKAKHNFSDNSIYFLVWGWITFIACTGQFVLKNIINYDKHYQIWLLIILGVAFNIYKGITGRKQENVKTYVGESMKFLWIGMGISFFVLSMIVFKIGWGFPVFPFFILLYGLGTFISGCILQFKPLVIGGILAWILSLAAGFASYDYQMLFAAAAILFSYILPAYILRTKKYAD